MPIEPAVLGAYVLAVGALIVSPGPDTLLILRYAMTSGRRAGLAAVAGVQVGLLGHTALAVAGISLIIASSPVLFKSVAVAGALYLGWLGVQGFRRRDALGLGGGGGRVSPRRALGDAALCNLLNPKVILLFLALLPNFIEPDRGNVTAQLLFLAGVLIFINTCWQTPMAWAADSLRHWLDRPARQMAISRLTGSILLAFAALMIYEHLL